MLLGMSSICMMAWSQYFFLLKIKYYPLLRLLLMRSMCTLTYANVVISVDLPALHFRFCDIFMNKVKYAYASLVNYKHCGFQRKSQIKIKTSVAITFRKIRY